MTRVFFRLQRLLNRRTRNAAELNRTIMFTISDSLETACSLQFPSIATVHQGHLLQPLDLTSNEDFWKTRDRTLLERYLEQQLRLFYFRFESPKYLQISLLSWSSWILLFTQEDWFRIRIKSWAFLVKGLSTL